MRGSRERPRSCTTRIRRRRSSRRAGSATGVRGGRRRDAAAPAFPHGAAAPGRKPDARPHAAPVQRRRRHALRRAGRAGSRTSTRTPGRRVRVRQQGQRRAGVGVRRPPVPGGRLPGHPSRHHPSLHARAGGRTVEIPHDREPRPCPVAQAVSERVRPAHRGCALLGAGHPPAGGAAPGRPNGRLSGSWPNSTTD